MNAVSLYRLAEQYQGLMALAGEDVPLEAIQDTLEALTGEIQIKGTNIAAFTLNTEAWADAAEDAGKKLIERAKRIRKRAEAMREYLRFNMATVGIKKIEGPEFTIARRSNPPKVIVAPDTEIPEAYLQPPHPIVEGILRAARDASAEQPGLDGYLILKATQLEEIITERLPKREPDKKKIADAIKAAMAAHEAIATAAIARGEAVPIYVAPVPGCHTESGERLEIRT